MATINLPVVFGCGPWGARCGTVRVEIPDGMTYSRIRRMAVHGPQSQHDADLGVGYRLLSPYRTGYNVWGRVNVVLPQALETMKGERR